MPRSPPGTDPRALPAPSADARAHGERVTAHIAQRIADAGGWISFADYMGAALYAPALGYYAAGTRKFGSDGDFVTAPEMSTLFGRALALQIAEVLTEVPGDVIELGPGTGRLAVDILGALAARDALPERYLLLEVSPDLRDRQQRTLEQKLPALLPRIAWIDVLPPRWRGAIVANEVLDAVPPHVIARVDGTWYERGVGLEADTLALVDRPLPEGALRSAASDRFPPHGDYASEINPAAQALVASLAQRCDAGALVLLDYGFPAAEYYHAQRSSGTVMAHYRHRALSDPLFLPGLTDLTAHIDFTAIASAGVAAGMRVAGFITQARFLINCGVLALLARAGNPASAAYLREANAVQKLLSPAEMGELFKVLALTRGIDVPLLGFRDGDQTHRL
ncbi:MAG: SAM-dependent methyltransferase [Casimicrobiaceae bacterium]